MGGGGGVGGVGEWGGGGVRRKSRDLDEDEVGPGLS